MRILHISNFSAGRCGIKNFGDQTSIALRAAGAEVTDWDCEYSAIYAKIQRQEPAYLPDDAASYDVIHYNWHPITSNTYGPGHFPDSRVVEDTPPLSANPFEPPLVQLKFRRPVKRPLLSVYLNDIPPWSGCPFHDRADIRFTAEPSPGCIELPYPVADWITDLPMPASEFTVGVAGVRGDGVEKVRQVCAAHGWQVLEPDRSGWMSFDDAVRHQARATVNVQWYHEGRGKSGGLSQAIASRRPVLINDSTMFSHFADYHDELYVRADLEAALVELYALWTTDRLRVPNRAIADRGWVSWGAPLMLRTWEEARRA